MILGTIRSGGQLAQVDQTSDENIKVHGRKGTYANKADAIKKAETVAKSDHEDAAVVKENGKYTVYGITEIGKQDPGANKTGSYQLHDFEANIVAFSATRRNSEGGSIGGEVTKHVSGSSTEIKFSTNAVTEENMPKEANLSLFAKEVAKSAPGSGVSLKLSLGVKAGSPGPGVSLEVRGTAELSVSKGTGVGAPYVAKLDLGFEGEAALSAFGNKVSVEMARNLSNGVAFYNENQVNEFAKLSVALTGKIASADVDGAQTALSNLTAYAAKHKLTGTNASETVKGETAAGTNISFQQTRSTSTLDSYKDNDADGKWDANEPKMQERVQEKGVSGSFTTKIGGSEVTVGVSSLTATLEDRKLNGVSTKEKEQSTATRIRIAIDPKILSTATDGQLMSIIEKAIGVTPGIINSGFTGADVRNALPGLRDAASKETRAGTAIIELAHLSETDGKGLNKGTTMLRLGVSAKFEGKLEMPVAAGLAITGGVKTEATYLREIKRW